MAYLCVSHLQSETSHIPICFCIFDEEFVLVQIWFWSVTKNVGKTIFFSSISCKLYPVTVVKDIGPFSQASISEGLFTVWHQVYALRTELIELSNNCWFNQMWTNVETTLMLIHFKNAQLNLIMIKYVIALDVVWAFYIFGLQYQQYSILSWNMSSFLSSSWAIPWEGPHLTRAVTHIECTLDDNAQSLMKME